jgi:hypothetical protein
MANNDRFIRKWEVKIGRNDSVRKDVLPSNAKNYADRKRDKDTTTYIDRYKSQTVSSDNLTTIPANVITIKDPIQIVAQIVDPKDDKKTNYTKTIIQLYNLKEDHWKFIRTGDSIFLRGGFEQDGEDLPHVFIGQITKVRHYPDYQNTITYIEANSCELVRQGAKISKSYPKGSTLKSIVEDLAKAVSQSGIPVGEINQQPIAAELLAKAYPSGYIVQESPLTALEKVCDHNGMKAYVSQGRLYIEPKKPRGELTNVVVIRAGQFKGKIENEKDKRGEEQSSDDDFKDNYDLKVNILLNGNITVNYMVRITAPGYEGLYTIKEIVHAMDYEGDKWDTTLTLLEVEN